MILYSTYYHVHYARHTQCVYHRQGAVCRPDDIIERSFSGKRIAGRNSAEGNVQRLLLLLLNSHLLENKHP